MESLNLVIRVWDKKRQELFIAKKFELDKVSGELKEVHGYTNPDSFGWKHHGGQNLLAKEERFLLMLWSGYYDVNHEMIFPEDIVQFCGMTITTGTVKFRHGKFIVQTKGNELDLCDVAKFKNLVILSNTFNVPGALPIRQPQ